MRAVVATAVITLLITAVTPAAGQNDEPIIGFRAVRFIRAKNADEARSIAVARVRNEWFSSPFCSVNRSQAPVITVDDIERIRNPFRLSRPNRGYDFYRDGEGQA